MTAPSWRSSGTYAAGVGTVAPGLPTGWQQNDIFILSVEWSGADAPTFTVSGWTQVGGNQRTGGTPATGTGLATFWRRATASESAPTVQDTGDHTSAIIHAFSGCRLTGDPVHQIMGTWSASESTSGWWPWVTTTVNDCMIVNVGTHGVDTLVDQFSGYHGEIATVTERSNDSTDQGNGGGLVVLTSIAAAPVTTDGTDSVTYATATARAWMTIALSPAALSVNAPAATPVFGINGATVNAVSGMTPITAAVTVDQPSRAITVPAQLVSVGADISAALALVQVFANAGHASASLAVQNVEASGSLTQQIGASTVTGQPSMAIRVNAAGVG